ncbi:MAG: cobalt transporter CbiM [Dictyoglomus sp.]|nr:cobalt transporter CbiM [Dictyoglomus sp.]MCX7942326.1 cobalt transporter CbiM [Dictyoglomaceae bacterium]MDW8188871.1 cobalt transporter CbiM [Dictyoglomus sp.]
MHIPDGYLGPQTYGSLFVVMTPFWIKAYNYIKKNLRIKQIPLIALGAAFSFVIMMFNIPIPGGTTGHAVGGVLLSILLGPWTTSIIISIVLIIQALIFGDGGITAIAANCFNLGIIMPFAGYFVYNILKGKEPLNSKKGLISAGIGAYVGLNMAALATAFMLGIQPYISKASDGKPLYCPYPLHVTIPAMMIEHLFLFGFIEAIITVLVLSYLIKTNMIKEWENV